MIRIPLWLVVAGVSLAASPGATRAATSLYPAGVKVAEYTGWSNAVHLGVGEVRAVVVPDAGGRLFRYEVESENILFEDPAAAGRVLGRGDWEWSTGGYQVDLGPELRGIPSRDLLWWGPWSWHIPGPFGARLTSKSDPATGMQLEKSFVLDPDNGDLGITQRMINTSDGPTNYCLWDRTVCKGGGYAIIPLNPRSQFRNGWALRTGERGRDWHYDGNASRPREVRIIKEHLVARCVGPATKIGADSTAGWIAYARGRLLFVKFFPFYADGTYTDGGCTVELYFDERVAELEPLSPEILLQPGQSFTFPEKWVLIQLKEPVNSHEDAVKVIGQIPRSPFR